MNRVCQAIDRDVVARLNKVAIGKSFSAKVERLIEDHEKTNITLKGKHIEDRFVALQLLIESGILHQRSSERIINVLWGLVFAMANSIKPEALNDALGPQFNRIVETAQLEKNLYPATDALDDGQIWLSKDNLRTLRAMKPGKKDQ